MWYWRGESTAPVSTAANRSCARTAAVAGCASWSSSSSSSQLAAAMAGLRGIATMAVGWSIDLAVDVVRRRRRRCHLRGRSMLEPQVVDFRYVGDGGGRTGQVGGDRGAGEERGEGRKKERLSKQPAAERGQQSATALALRVGVARERVTNQKHSAGAGEPGVFAAAAPENMPAPSQPLASPALAALSVPLHPIPRPRGDGWSATRQDRAGCPTPRCNVRRGGMGCVQSATTLLVGQWRAVPCSRTGRGGVRGDDQKVEADVEAGRRIYLCLKEKGVGNP